MRDQGNGIPGGRSAPLAQRIAKLFQAALAWLFRQRRKAAAVAAPALDTEPPAIFRRPEEPPVLPEGNRPDETTFFLKAGAGTAGTGPLGADFGDLGAELQGGDDGQLNQPARDDASHIAEGALVFDANAESSMAVKSSPAGPSPKPNGESETGQEDLSQEVEPLTSEPRRAADADDGREVGAAINTGANGGSQVLTDTGQDAVPEGPKNDWISEAVADLRVDPDDARDIATSGDELPLSGSETGALVDVSEHEPDLEPIGPRPTTKYRPRLRQRTGEEPTVRTTANRAANPSGAGSLDADILLSLLAGGSGISTAVLLRRQADMSEEITVTLSGETLDLVAIDDVLFEPVALPNPAAALATGITAETEGPPRRRWARTGRRLHAFSGRQGVTGFASVARVLIGQENVILCEASLADAVLRCCERSGSDRPIEIAGPGVPDGWRCYRGIFPHHPGDWGDGEEILVALSPLPDAAIEFSGGISIGRNNWIAGRPPSIRILGADPMPGEVTIDGKTAISLGDAWAGPTWDSKGQHVVRYAGMSRGYEISEPDEVWAPWPAHQGAGLQIVGAHADASAARLAIVLEWPACWVIGARPGQVAWAAARGGISVCTTADFTPVWAIAPKTGRRRPSPMLLDALDAPMAAGPDTLPSAVLRWCRIVRDATGGPVAAGADREAEALWQLYAAAARRHRKRYR